MAPIELVGLVRRLLGEVDQLGKENEKLKAEVAELRGENQQLKDGIRRLKHLAPRPVMKPSGMEEATDEPQRETEGQSGAPPRRRGPGVSKLRIDRTAALPATVPPGSRHKGYEEIVVQDVVFKPATTLCRRERWNGCSPRSSTGFPRL